MKRSTDRVLTTHAGSLPRPDDVLAMLRAGEKGERFEARVREAVSEIVQQQVEIGLDIVDDGEVSKPSFVTYATERLGGLESHPADPIATSTFANSREHLALSRYLSVQFPRELPGVAGAASSLDNVVPDAHQCSLLARTGLLQRPVAIGLPQRHKRPRGLSPGICRCSRPGSPRRARPA